MKSSLSGGPIQPDRVRRCFLNVTPGDEGEGYEHASRELKDVFDAIGLAATELSVDRGGNMELLAAHRGSVGGPKQNLNSTAVQRLR